MKDEEFISPINIAGYRFISYKTKNKEVLLKCDQSLDIYMSKTEAKLLSGSQTCS